MEIGLIQRIDVNEEMQQAYLDYAMSVIVARALPDARDGLKPVHRRILYAMHDMGIRLDTPYKKSARIVGEVLGKYHPHGDEAVYESMARMAQDFSMRYPLVDGQGNFGSVDGDAPAAMRYTEARLAATAGQMLADIQKNTVNFDDNFDGTLKEPSVLPSALPNLLVNGATGIAVGMATSIPPHNLGEIVAAMHHMLENWDKLDDLSINELMKFVQGPDFPTGGIILHEEESDGLISAYSTGRGRVTVQASAHLEEMERGRNRIIVNELPYLTNKSTLIERIASLVREEKLEGIADLRDESDRQGMRIVIELTRTADPETVLKDLYRTTPMQSTFSINMLALVDGEPRVLSLKQALRFYIEHRLEIVRRRSEFDLEKARQRAHILEGLLAALHNLDEVISIIRKSPDAEVARERLIKRFKLSQIQAQAILDMPLRRLAALERKKIEEEYRAIQASIKELDALLRSPKKMRQVVDQELQAVKEEFADRRRTHIAHLKAGVSKSSLLTAGELKPEKIIWVAVTPDGLVSRSMDEQMPRLSGKEAPQHLIQTNTRDTLYLVTEQGEAAALPVHSLPETENPLSGLPIQKVSALKDSGSLAAIFALPAKDKRVETASEGYLLTATRQGLLKKTALAELPGPSAGTFILARVNSGDRLGWIRQTRGDNELILATSDGMAIRFLEDEIRPMGLVAAGVMGIKLAEKQEVVGVEVLPPQGEIFLLASDGNAKRVPPEQFSRQGRYGQGLIAWKLTPKVQLSGMTAGPGSTRIILHLDRLVSRSLRLDEAPLATRSSRGQTVIDLKAGDKITGLTVPLEAITSGKQKVKSSRPETPSARQKTGLAQAGKAAPGAGEKPTGKTTPLARSKPAQKETSPASTPAKAPAKTSVKTPATAPAKPPAKAPAKTPAKAPATVPAKTPAKAPATTPAKTPIKSPTGAPAKAPVKAPTKTPPKAAAKTPTKAPATAPAKTPIKSPTGAPAKAPVKASTKTPAKAAAKTPAKASATAPAKAPAKAVVKPVSRAPAKPDSNPARVQPGASQKAKASAATPQPASPTPKASKASPTKTKQPAGQKPAAKQPAPAKPVAAGVKPAPKKSSKPDSEPVNPSPTRSTPKATPASSTPRTSQKATKPGDSAVPAAKTSVRPKK